MTSSNFHSQGWVLGEGFGDHRARGPKWLGLRRLLRHGMFQETRVAAAVECG